MNGQQIVLLIHFRGADLERPAKKNNPHIHTLSKAKKALKG
jgi:hypothetical protein